MIWKLWCWSWSENIWSMRKKENPSFVRGQSDLFILLYLRFYVTLNPYVITTKSQQNLEMEHHVELTKTNEGDRPESPERSQELGASHLLHWQQTLQGVCSEATNHDNLQNTSGCRWLPINETKKNSTKLHLLEQEEAETKQQWRMDQHMVITIKKSLLKKTFF